MTSKSNQQFFSGIKFLTSIYDIKNLPKSHSNKEIVFAGRSNCGKSSLINAIANQKQLAITSKSPGRTQAINYFQLVNNNYLVDLPGYGYAKVNQETKKKWGLLIKQYLNIRTNIAGIILIMDIRHPLTEFDVQMLEFSNYYKWPVCIALNKADKLSKLQINNTINNIKPKINDPNILIYPCSAIKKTGIKELQEQIRCYG